MENRTIDKTISRDSRNREELMLRLSVIGLPKSVSGRYIDLVQKWYDCSGRDWTVKRLKDLKMVLIRQQAGYEPHIWLKRNSKGLISGPVGEILRWSQKSERNFAKAIQVFMLYTYWVSSSITADQKKKFFFGIDAKPVSNVDFEKAFDYFVCKSLKSFKRPLSKPKPLICYRGSENKRSPLPGTNKSVRQNESVLKDFGVIGTNQGLWLMYHYRRIFSPLHKGISKATMAYRFETRRSTYPEFWMNQLPVGTVGFIQEPGCKLRSVANPYRIYQEALRPLGNHLYDIVKQRLPWDCTHDQTKAFKPVMHALLQKQKVHSVDLSNATDFFPMSLTASTVKAVLATRDLDYLSLWETISRGTWHSQLGDVRWKKGQPLGVHPSFAAFTMTHGMLLLFLLVEIKSFRLDVFRPKDISRVWDGEFYVVGDDVVILNDKLCQRYKETLTQLGCPFSPEKTISSNSLAEFAGKVITSKGVYPQMKWRELSDDNFVDICRLLGPRSEKLLRPRQRAVFNEIKGLIEPFGLNFSQPGDNLEKMIIRTMDSPIFRDKDDCRSALTELRRLLQRNVYEANIDIRLDIDSINELDKTFDENVKKALEDVAPYFKYKQWSPSIGGLSSVLGMVRNNLSLPLVSPPVGRQTQLEFFERLLNRRT